MGIAKSKRMLVPTDFSPTSDQALDAAVELAGLMGSSIELAHVWQVPGYAFADGMLVAPPELLAQLQTRIGESMEQRAGRVRAAGLDCRIAILQGSPHLELLRHAVEQQVDLIVMGTHGRSGVRHALLGSVAERVVQKAPCPVLVVPLRERG